MSQPTPPSGVAWWDLFQVFLYVGIVAGGTVVGFMVYSAIKNRETAEHQKAEVETKPGRGRTREAIIFASLSSILLFGLGVTSLRLTTQIQYPPPISESLVIQVTAFQWNFRFDFPNNVSTIAECRVPSEKTVIFNVTSSDVFHNFGLPDFKLKIDAIPGKYNILWITTPSLTGQTELRYQIRCYELCGSAGHTFMVASLIVMNQTAFNQWLFNQTGG